MRLHGPGQLCAGLYGLLVFTPGGSAQAWVNEGFSPAWLRPWAGGGLPVTRVTLTRSSAHAPPGQPKHHPCTGRGAPQYDQRLECQVDRQTCLHQRPCTRGVQSLTLRRTLVRSAPNLPPPPHTLRCAGPPAAALASPTQETDKQTAARPDHAQPCSRRQQRLCLPHVASRGAWSARRRSSASPRAGGEQPGWALLKHAKGYEAFSGSSQPIELKPACAASTHRTHLSTLHNERSACGPWCTFYRIWEDPPPPKPNTAQHSAFCWVCGRVFRRRCKSRALGRRR